MDIARLVPSDEEAVGLWRGPWTAWRRTPANRLVLRIGWGMRPDRRPKPAGAHLFTGFDIAGKSGSEPGL